MKTSCEKPGNLKVYETWLSDERHENLSKFEMLSFNRVLVIEYYVWFAFLFVQTVYFQQNKEKHISKFASEICHLLHSYNLQIIIMLTCLCKVDPLTPHIYIVKVGFTWVYIIFLFLL